MDTQNVTRGQIVFTRRQRWGVSYGTLNRDTYGSDKMLSTSFSTAIVARSARRPHYCDDCAATIQKGEICARSEFGTVYWCANCVTVRKPLTAVAFPDTPAEYLTEPVVPDYEGPAFDTQVIARSW